MVSFPQILLRGSQFLWTLLITALIGNVIASAFAGNPSSINYAIFVAVFSWIAMFYGFAAAFMDSLAIPVVLIAMDVLAALFTFIAGVVLAAKLGVHSCGNQVRYLATVDLLLSLTSSQGYISSNSLTNGSHDMSKRCHELQASTAFFWFLFASYLGSIAMDFISGGSSVNMRRGGIRKGGPSMSQV